MSGKASQPPPGISPSTPIRGEDYLPPDYVEGRCWVTGCVRKYGTNIDISHFQKRFLPDLFGLLPDTDDAFKDWKTYFDWLHYPDWVWVCMRHYGVLRNKHGVDMAWRYRNGRIKGIVQGFWF